MHRLHLAADPSAARTASGGDARVRGDAGPDVAADLLDGEGVPGGVVVQGLGEDDPREPPGGVEQRPARVALLDIRVERVHLAGDARLAVDVLTDGGEHR